jgi:hypothetical protein
MSPTVEEAWAAAVAAKLAEAVEGGDDVLSPEEEARKILASLGYEVSRTFMPGQHFGELQAERWPKGKGGMNAVNARQIFYGSDEVELVKAVVGK